MKRDNSVASVEGDSKLPKWFVNFMASAILLVATISIAAVPWAYNLSMNVNTLNVRVETFSGTVKHVEDLREEVESLKGQVNLLLFWKQAVDKKLDKTN